MVEVEGLRVELASGGTEIVEEIDFSIEAGEITGLVGESGSGKTTVGLALLGHARRGARIADGRVLIDGVDVLDLDPDALTRIRGATVSYVAQDPASALNPALRLRRQLLETLEAHGFGEGRAERIERMREVLGEVGLPSDDEFLSRYPHQLSGGQQQRLAIGMAFACRPKVIVCDEPTTGLDVTTQAKVLGTIRELCRAHGVAALYVSHDLGVVADLAQQVLVMYAGRLVERGERRQVFVSPAHPYTRRLLAAIPSMSQRLKLDPIPGQAPAPGARPAGCPFEPRCELAIAVCRERPPDPVELAPGHSSWCVRSNMLATETARRSTLEEPGIEEAAAPLLEVEGVDVSFGANKVLHGVDVDVKPRECLALVGESGSGKTTLSRVIVGLVEPIAGSVSLAGDRLPATARSRSNEVRQRLQYVFQSPYNSLNPRHTVGDIIAGPLRHFTGVGGAEARTRVEGALEDVALAARTADKFPDQLSGGERQRVAIARALIAEPQVLICDEITSALDVSVQASIINLLQRLREQRDLTLLFVTHNLPLVRSFADRVVVMNQGRIVERGAVAQVLSVPDDDYTRELVADTPDPVMSA